MPRGDPDWAHCLLGLGLLPFIRPCFFRKILGFGFCLLAAPGPAADGNWQSRGLHWDSEQWGSPVFTGKAQTLMTEGWGRAAGLHLDSNSR